MPTPPPASTPSRPRPHGGWPLRLLRALSALAALAAIVGGTPVLLYAATRAIWGPASRAMPQLLDRQDTGSVLLLVLLAVGWLAWAQFTICVIAEIPAQLRGHTVRRRRGLGLSQRTAATLVGSILVLAPAGTALATPGPALATPAAAAERTPGPASSPGANVAPTAADTSRAVEGSLYTVRDVRPAESLWTIAERLLGDGARAKEIADLNAGRTMADGSTFRPDAVLQPGWQLRLPSDARPFASAATGEAASAPPADRVPQAVSSSSQTADEETRPQPRGNSAVPETRTSAGEGVQREEASAYVVEPGDSLWEIAETELGDGTEYQKIFEENRGEPQPGGGTFTDPGLIFPGQELDVPAADGGHQDAPGGSGREEVQAPAPGQDAPSKRGEDAEKPAPEAGRGDLAEPDDRSPGPPTTAAPEQPDAGRGEAEAPAPPSSTEPSPSAERSAPSSPRPSSPAAGSPSGEVSHDPAVPVSKGDAAIELRTVAGIASVLAACLVAALSIRRIIQQRRRKPGETIAMPSEPGQLEQALTASSTPASVDLLDRALRTLASAVSEAQGRLPSLIGARILARDIEVVVEDDADGPLPPFKAAYAPGRWRLDPGAVLLEDEAARQVPAPYPGLVTVGTGDEGGERSIVLLNLPQARTLLLDGDVDDVRAVCRSIAMEAATSAWADHAEILLLSVGEELPTLLPSARLRHVPDAGAAVRDLGERLLEEHQWGDQDAATTPWMLICAGELTEAEAWALADAASKAHALPLALVVPAASSNLFPQAERLDAARTEQQPVEVLDAAVTLQRVDDDAYRELVATLQTAEKPAQPPAGAWQHVPAEAPPPPLYAPPDPAGSPDGAGGPAAGSAAYPALLQAAAHTEPGPARADAESAPPDGGASPAAASAASAIDPSKESAGLPVAAGALEKAAPVKDAAPAMSDLRAPELRVLGPVTISGVGSSGHGPKLAALAALLYFRPDRDAAAVAEAMDPLSPWSPSTLRSRMSELRNALGSGADGELYVPRRAHRLSKAVRCDWTTFKELAERGLAAGTAGLPDLEAALALVRGRPLADRDYPWALTLQQEMITRIVDVAHTVATFHLGADRPDFDASRRAVAVGLEVEETAELLYRDWMRIEHALGNRPALHRAISELQQINRRYNLDAEPETDRLISVLLAGGDRPVPARQGAS